MKMRFPTLILLLFCTAFFFPAHAQVAERIFQVSGMVISRSGRAPIPYVTVQVNHSRQGTQTSIEGFYSIPASESDTLYFHHIGYKRGRLIMKDYLADYTDLSTPYIYVVNYLTEDSLTLPTVTIFPYDTPAELRTAFLNMENTETQMERSARENMDPKVIQSIMASLDVDGQERLGISQQKYYTDFTNRYLSPNVGFNPLAALALLKYIVDKSEKRRNKDLNYWE